MQDKSPLEKHIGFFSDKNGDVTYDSMLDKLTQIGDKNAETKANVISFMGGIKVKGCPYSMFKPAEAVGKLNHPQNTGIYQADGFINEARWQKLCEWSEIDKGINIITQKNFYSFLGWARSQDDSWDFLAKTFSNGEWKDFFTACTDYWKETEVGMERAVTIDTLRKFFEDTPQVLNRTIAHELPVQPSKIM